MSHAQSLLIDIIFETTNFSKLETLRGMVLGFYTSPLIKEYRLLPAVDLLQSYETDKERLLEVIKLQMKALGIAREKTVKVIGHYQINGLTVDKVAANEPSAEDVKTVRDTL